jgi:hypothetical protein
MKKIVLVLFLTGSIAAFGRVAEFFNSERKDYCPKKAKEFNETFEKEAIPQLQKCRDEESDCKEIRELVFRALGKGVKDENPDKYGFFFNPLVGYSHPEIQRFFKNEERFFLHDSFFQGEECKLEIKKAIENDFKIATAFVGALIVAGTATGHCYLFEWGIFGETPQN